MQKLAKAGTCLAVTRTATCPDSAVAQGPTDMDRALVERLTTLAGISGRLDWETPDQASPVLADLEAIVAEFIASKHSAPAVTVGRERPPCDLTPVGLRQALRELVEQISHSGIDTTNSRFLGYIPGGGLPAAAATNFITSLFNRYVGMAGAAPGAAALENQALAWLIKLFKLPDAAWGTFTSGGSVATLTALVAARDSAPLADRGRLICYMTDQSHYANKRALHVIGFPIENIRIVPTDTAHRMDTQALSAMVEADKNLSLRPWVVIASAGTTNTGAIDPLERIAGLCESNGIWLHVDAAYGGMFMLVPELIPTLLSISRANSIVVDPHKGMFLPYGCGAVLVANGEHLRSALAAGATYLAGLESQAHRSPNDYSIELTRPSRGAQIWTVLKAYGEETIAGALEEKLLLARLMQSYLHESGRFEVVKEQDLSIVTFRVPSGDLATNQLLADLSRNGRYLLSSTVLNGQVFLRCCVLCFRTHKEDIDGLFAELMRLVS